MLGDGPTQLEMPGIELLGTQKTMCEVVRDQQTDRKFCSQTMKPSSAIRCQAATDQNMMCSKCANHENNEVSGQMYPN